MIVSDYFPVYRLDDVPFSLFIFIYFFRSFDKTSSFHIKKIHTVTMLVNAKLSWQHAVLSALVMSSAVSANYGNVHVRRGEHAVRDILPNNAHALKERDLLSTLSGLLGGAGAGAGNDNAAEAAAGQQQQGKKNQAQEGAAGAGEAAAGAQDEEESAAGEAAAGEAAAGEDAQEADDEDAQEGQNQGKGQGKNQGQDEAAAAAGEAAAGSKFQNPTVLIWSQKLTTHLDAAGGGMKSP